MSRMWSVLAVGVVAAIAAVGTARAQTGTLSQDSNFFPYGSDDINISYSGPGGPIAVDAVTGEVRLDFKVGSLTTIYNAFCTDIFSDWSSPATYTLSQITSYQNFQTGSSATTYHSGGTASQMFSAIQYNQLLALLNGVASTNYITSKTSGSQAQSDASAAVQLAIWEIENEYTPQGGTYSLTGGNFTASGYDTGVQSDTTYLFNQVEGSSPAWNNTSGVLSEFTINSGDQDFSFLTVGQQSGGSTPVPEPGSLALLATGLAGFAALRRRRARA